MRSRAEPRLALTDVSQAYSKLLATVWRVSYHGVSDNGCFTHDLHTNGIIGYIRNKKLRFSNKKYSINTEPLHQKKGRYCEKLGFLGI